MTSPWRRKNAVSCLRKVTGSVRRSASGSWHGVHSPRAHCSECSWQLGVLVAAEALAHRRQRRALRIDDARVTRHALPANFGHREVFVVVDGDFTADARRRRGEHRSRLVRVLVATVTDRRLGQAVFRVVLDDVVAAHAAQALRLAGSSARDPGEVDLVRKARRRRFAAASDDHGDEHREPQDERRGNRAEPRRLHFSLGREGASNWTATRSIVCASSAA
jgi:hypothetical protein